MRFLRYEIKGPYNGNEYIKKLNENRLTISKTQSQDQVLYLKGLDLLLDNYIDENPEKELADNIVQLYLLQVHNFYKNRFYLQLLKYDKYATRIIALALILYVVTISILLVFIPETRIFLLQKTF